MIILGGGQMLDFILKGCFETLYNFVYLSFRVSFGGDPKKAVASFYSVPLSGKCETCRGLTGS